MTVLVVDVKENEGEDEEGEHQRQSTHWRMKDEDSALMKRNYQSWSAKSLGREVWTPSGHLRERCY